jgi:16S rRNA (guanine1516-N2)-methyltransferase
MPVSLAENISVVYQGQGSREYLQDLANRLAVGFTESHDNLTRLPTEFGLTWRQNCLYLIDKETFYNGGLFVDIGHRPGEQLSWPTAKTGAFAQALGRKTQTVIDATAGWGQDSLAMFRMGYKVYSIERSAIMSALLQDGFNRLQGQEWVQRLQLSVPQLLVGNAACLMKDLSFSPDCIYLDPMFPSKRKKSALPKKAMVALRTLVGDDNDKDILFAEALKLTGKRVVVKCPDYAEPLGGKPNASFIGKLVRYDVYFNN